MPTLKRDMTPKPWFFNWKNGGYNSVRAENREEAIQLAKEKAAGTTLELDESTLVLDLKGRLVERANKAYAGMFD